MREINFYDVLGVERTATAEQIRRAYDEKKARAGQDQSVDARDLEWAYRALSDPARRAKFDVWLSLKLGPVPPAPTRSPAPRPAAPSAGPTPSSGAPISVPARAAAAAPAAVRTASAPSASAPRASVSAPERAVPQAASAPSPRAGAAPPGPMRPTAPASSPAPVRTSSGAPLAPEASRPVPGLSPASAPNLGAASPTVARSASPSAGRNPAAAPPVRAASSPASPPAAPAARSGAAGTTVAPAPASTRPTKADAPAPPAPRSPKPPKDDFSQSLKEILSEASRLSPAEAGVDAPTVKASAAARMPAKAESRPAGAPRSDAERPAPPPPAGGLGVGAEVNLYAVLRVSRDATMGEIDAAYNRLLALSGKEPSIDKPLLQIAYDELSNAQRRLRYNKKLDQATKLKRRKDPRRAERIRLILGGVVIVLLIAASVSLYVGGAGGPSVKVNDTLYQRDTGEKVGVVVDVARRHEFADGRRAAAFLIRRESGADEWFTQDSVEQMLTTTPPEVPSVTLPEASEPFQPKRGAKGGLPAVAPLPQAAPVAPEVVPGSPEAPLPSEGGIESESAPLPAEDAGDSGDGGAPAESETPPE